MRILVTGGAGFIGSHVADAFLAAGHSVLIVDDLSSGHERNLPAGAEFERTDIREPEFERRVAAYRPQAVAHLAAQIDVRKSVADPVHDAGINVLGTIRVAQAVARAGCQRILFASTGGAIYGEQDAFPAAEDHPARPVSPYGTAKLCAEAYLAMFERLGGPPATCLRFANVYGPRQDPHGEAGVVAIFGRRMLTGQSITIFGDGSQTRDYVYVEDVARAHLLALEAGQGGAFNIGTGVETDVNRLAEQIRLASGWQQAPVYAPARPGEQQRSCVDPARAGELLGWRPQVDLSSGIARTIQAFRDNPDW
jgi:UDP-glucose 4-epimerase